MWAGNGGQSPKHAQLLAGGLDDATLVKYIDRYLMFYIRTADRSSARRRGSNHSKADSITSRP